MSASSSAALWIDDRYRGAHGIGRYAHEVISRLSIPWQSLGLDGKPANPVDFLRRLPRDAYEGLVYSPGYGALIRAKRQVLTIHDLIHLEVDWPGRAKYLAYYNGVVKPVIKRTGVVLTVSETSRRAISEWIGDDSVRIVNAGIGLSSVFTSNETTQGAERPYVLYVGNLRPHKNLRTVLRSMAFVDDVRLAAVLPAAELPEAAGIAESIGVASKVDWLTGADDGRLATLYRGARATLMPSAIEGFGLPALESVMCGTPVIYWSGCAAVAETVGRRGTQVDGLHDPRGWADAIVRENLRSTPIAPPRDGLYDWGETAATIQATLSNLLR